MRLPVILLLLLVHWYVIGAGIGVHAQGDVDQATARPDDTAPVISGLIPIGPPTGADRGRIVRMKRPEAVIDFVGQPSTIRNMLDEGIRALTHQSDTYSAWSSIVSPADRVGIFIAPTGWNDISTLVPIVLETYRGVASVGIPSQRIFIWSRQIDDIRRLRDACSGHIPFSQFVSSVEQGWDKDHTYESPIVGSMIWSDVDFGSEEPDAGRLSHVSKLLTQQLDRIIQINSMTSDRSGGIRGHLMSLSYASVDNFNRFFNPPQILAESVPEIYALNPIADKVCLFITDALVGSVAGNQPGKLHLHPALAEIWVSRDPVALDAYSLHRANSLRSTIGFPELPGSARELISNSAIMELGSDQVSSFSILELIR
jgi:hypothetical protein